MSASHIPAVGAETKAEEHAHPGVGSYIRIALVLAALTVLEVFVYTQGWLGALMVPTLLGLAVAKFILVVGFYMHLRFDSVLFTFVFGFGLFIALGVVTALMFLFGHNPLPVHASSGPLH